MGIRKEEEDGCACMNESYCEDCYLDRESLSASCAKVVFKALLIPREIDLVHFIVGLSRDLAPQ